MKNKKTIIACMALSVFAAVQFLYPQESGRRYTFIAKDGSQIINVFLVQEKENSYIIQIGEGNKTIVVEKKNIEKLIQTDTPVPVDYIPVTGRESELKSPPELNEIAQLQEVYHTRQDYNISLAVTGHTVPGLNEDSGYNSRGWGVELLPVLGFRELGFFQLGAGFSYYSLNSSVQDKAANLSMYSVFGYLQFSYRPGFLSFDYLSFRPFIGASLGGAFSYALTKRAEDEGSNSEERSYSSGSYYGFRFGLGMSAGKHLPVEFLLSIQYSIISDNDIKNFTQLSLGINYYFQ